MTSEPTIWRATVLTLFPEMFPGPLGVSLAGKALAAGLWSLEARDIRGFGHRLHRSVDDTPAGGGPGMVLRADVLAAAIDAADAGQGRPRLLMSPRGRPLTQPRVIELADGPGAVIVCGRFEGVDERVIEAAALEEVSIGDYVLSGGEIAALVLLDACVRLLPGVMGKEASGRGGKLCRRATGIPPIHPPAGFRGPRHPGNPDLRRPCQGRGLAAGGGRGADPGPPAGPLGRPRPGQKAQKDTTDG